MIPQAASRIDSVATPAAALRPLARTAKLEIELLDSLAAAESPWREFERTADCTVFQSFDFLAAWQRQIGSGRGAAPAIVIVHEGDETLLLAPLAVERFGPARRLVWLGQDLADYVAPLLARDFSRRVEPNRFVSLWSEICATLQRNPRLRHDFVDIQKLPETIGVQLNPFLQLPVSLHPSGAYLTKLEGDWESYYADRRSTATRRRDHSKLKKLAEIGAIRFITPHTKDDIAATVDTLIEQKSRSFARQGIPNLFAKPGVREFFLDLATNDRTRSMVHVSRLDVGGKPAATNLGFEFRGRYYYVLASYAAGETARFGAGAAHLRELMKRAFERGLREFDFTIGDERYKLEWADTASRLYDHIAASTARGWPAVAARRALSGTKRWIKQTPLLWELFVRVRSGLGGLRADSVTHGR